MTIKHESTGDEYKINLKNSDSFEDIPPGKYRFNVDSDSGFRTTTNRFTISADQRQVVEVWWEPKTLAENLAVEESTQTKITGTPERDQVLISVHQHGFNFDGVDDHVVIPSLTYNGNSPITIEFVASPSGKDDRMQRFVVSNGDYVNKVESGFSLYAMGNRYPNPVFTSWAFGYADRSGGRGSLAAGREAWKPERFSHVAAVIEGRKWRWYIDGRLLRHGEMKDKPSASKQPFMIGRHPIFNGFFRGTIKEVRFSKTAKYRAIAYEVPGQLAADDATVALYRPNSISAGTNRYTPWVDLSPNGHNGTLSDADGSHGGRKR